MQESEQSWICIRGIYFASVSMIFWLNFSAVQQCGIFILVLFNSVVFLF